MVADYSQQESRILAELANEDTLIDFFNTGDGDLHSYTARLMFKVPVDKKTNANLRQLAKVLVFGIAYGMSAHKLSNDFQVSLEEAEKFIENFYATYPKLKDYFHRVQNEALSTGKILINALTNHRFLADSVYRAYQDAKGVIDANRYSKGKIDKSV